jgi:RimJ/RimL family protein N-acetyltransferase
VLEFVHHVLRTTMPECPEVWIDPDPRNVRAVRAYEAAGFIDTGIDLPDLEHPDQVRRLMKMSWAGPTFR